MSPSPWAVKDARERRQRAFEAASGELARELGQLAQVQPSGVVRVPSRTTPGVSYEVHIATDGSLICSCPASFNELECWHVKYVREEMMTQTAVAIRPVNLQPSSAPLPTRDEMSLIQQAAAMAFSGAVALPKELNTPQKVAAVMLYGWELGLKPMTALAELYIVNGRVAPSAKVMAGLVMRDEPDIRLLVEELTEESCTMRIQRPSRKISETYTVTWGEIKKAGLDRNPMNTAYPRDRLRYHCTKRLLRIYAPDLITGMGRPSLDGVPLADAPQAFSQADLYNEGDEPIEGDYRNIDTETGEILEPVAMITDDQQARIKKLWDPRKPSAKIIRASWPIVFPYPGSGGAISLGKLTEADADAVLALLEKPEAPASASSGAAAAAAVATPPAQTPAHEPACGVDGHDAYYDETATVMKCRTCGLVLEGPNSVLAPEQKAIL